MARLQVRKETGDVCFKARFVTGFFKTEEAYVSEDEESFEPGLCDPVCATAKSVAALPEADV